MPESTSKTETCATTYGETAGFPSKIREALTSTPAPGDVCTPLPPLAGTPTPCEVAEYAISGPAPVRFV